MTKRIPGLPGAHDCLNPTHAGVPTYIQNRYALVYKLTNSQNVRFIHVLLDALNATQKATEQSCNGQLNNHAEMPLECIGDWWLKSLMLQYIELLLTLSDINRQTRFVPHY
jgi:hypothetical protein